MLQTVCFQDWGKIDYKEAWDKQEEIFAEKLAKKKENKDNPDKLKNILHHLFFCEHNHVYTIGKSGLMEHLLLGNETLQAKGISFYKNNRGGDITYHGPGQIVGYPILDLEQYKPDIHWYMRSLEEVMIQFLAKYNLKGDRSTGETGVWLDVGKPNARKICAFGVRTSRWVTMHGWALNINTDLQYFNYIVPCGIVNKGVTSLQQELGKELDLELCKTELKQCFENVFESMLK